MWSFNFTSNIVKPLVPRDTDRVHRNFNAKNIFRADRVEIKYSENKQNELTVEWLVEVR